MTFATSMADRPSEEDEGGRNNSCNCEVLVLVIAGTY
jgi:hypothetical protein